MKELKKVRNIAPGMHKGLWTGMMISGIETALGGHTPWTLKNVASYAQIRKTGEYEAPDRGWGERTLPPKDRLASVYFAATEHDEDQPVHLQVSDTNICVTRCAEEYNNPCTRFCPAAVYEIVQDAAGKRLQINAANCVHCKTCDIKDPYQIINWVTPEGGAGPNYVNL
jgi:electron-transferring-flavoprotein dehydrogenase